MSIKSGNGLLASLNFDNRFTRELPADPDTTNRRKERWALQLKGAGPTPYARTADGLAVIPAGVFVQRSHISSGGADHPRIEFDSNQ